MNSTSFTDLNKKLKEALAYRKGRGPRSTIGVYKDTKEFLDFVKFNIIERYISKGKKLKIFKTTFDKIQNATNIL